MNRRQVILDVTGLLGLGLFGYGVWLVYPPAAFMVSGAALVSIAALVSRRTGP